MRLLDLFYPKFCVSCGVFGAYLCPDCLTSIQPPEYFSEAEIAPLDGLWSLGHYSGVLEDAIHQIKYGFIKDILNEISLHPSHFEADFITFVPMHIQRKAWRGFNQAELLAKKVSTILNLPVYNLLQKTLQTVPQVGLDEADREKNLRGAFEFKQTINIHGKNIILVDDVWTTGSTMKECCQVLKKGGAGKVYAMTLAR